MASYGEIYSLNVLVNGQNVINSVTSTISVSPAVVFPPLSIVEGDNVATAVAGAYSTFQVYLFDAFNNSITQPPVDNTPTVTIDQVLRILLTGN